MYAGFALKADGKEMSTTMAFVRMLAAPDDNSADVFFYITMMNQNHAQPNLQAGSEADIIRGCYKISSWSRPYSGRSGNKMLSKTAQKVTLMGSGAILTEIIKAAVQLDELGIQASVYSVTSWSELARDGAACQQRTLNGEASSSTFVQAQLSSSEGPIIAATDYVRAVPESIRAFLPPGRSYLTLGTDGFGRSDTRAALREFFSVDAASIVKAALQQLG